MKLEGQIIARHPEYDMDERMLLHKIDFENGTVTIELLSARLITE